MRLGSGGGAGASAGIWFQRGSFLSTLVRSVQSWSRTLAAKACKTAWVNRAVHRLSQVKSAPTPVGRAQCKGGGGKEKYMYIHANGCTICRRLSENVVAAFTWSRNAGNSEAKHPIEAHFSQHFPSCPKLCTCRTFPVLCPKFVVGAHGNDLLEVESTQVLSSPSVRQVNLQCKEQISSIESYISVTRKKFHWHGPSDPHAHSTRAKYHAIALTNPCLVEAPQCDEQAFEIERHIFVNVFCIKVGALQRSMLLKKQLLQNSAVGV